MRVLLDTNIVIHRENSTISNYSIGHLFRWLDKLKVSKVSPVCDEITESCEQLLAEKYNKLLEDVNGLTKGNIEDSTGYGIRGIEYFLDDCPDSKEKTILA